MIFVTIGSCEPFDRLMKAIEGLPDGEEIVAQCGDSTRRPDAATCVDFLPFDELVELMIRARIVITHAGVGSILTALANGRRPVVVPRLHRLGEAVDDHQLELARRLHDQGSVVLVEDLDELPTLVAGGGSADPAPTSNRLAEDIRGYVNAAIKRPNGVVQGAGG